MPDKELNGREIVRELERYSEKYNLTYIGKQAKVVLDFINRLQAGNEKVGELIEDVLDTLTEVGNGVTDEQLHKAADKLFKARDILSGEVITYPVRGEWLCVYRNKKATVYECSRCGHLSFGISDYCICGAKMGGESDV